MFRVLPITLIGVNCQLDVYALFDDGSSVTMIDRDLAEKLGVRGKPTNLNMNWFGDRSVKNVFRSI